MSSFKKLQKTLGVTSAEFVRITKISLRTLQRRQKSGKFLPDESERIFRLSCAVDQALHVMRDEEAARSWMNMPIYKGRLKSETLERRLKTVTP